MYNKNNIIFSFFIFLWLSIQPNVFAEELDIKADNITIKKEKNIVQAEGSVLVEDAQGNKIFSDKTTYYRSKNILESSGNVIIDDDKGNQVQTSKISYDQNNNFIESFEDTNLSLINGYNVSTNAIVYDFNKKLINSESDSIITDKYGNEIFIKNFSYNLKKKLISATDDVKIYDVEGNKYFVENVYIDLQNRRILGDKVKVALDPKSFGLPDEENDPRFAANSILLTENVAELNKGVFTICKLRNEKCPPWSMQAKNIKHDKNKKTIYYKSAILKIYDIPFIYLPRFFHPDPTVKRQSGFLAPTITETTSLGLGVSIPYFVDLADNKDFTFTPKFYSGDRGLYLGEYRHVTENSSWIFDSGYTKGYKNPKGLQTSGSRNHFFFRSNIDLDLDLFDESTLYLNMQRVSNDTYLKVHKINTELTDYGNSELTNEIGLNLGKGDTTLSVKGYAYEDISDPENSRYEFLVPQINLDTLLLDSENFGVVNLSTKSYYKNKNVDEKESFIINDLTWNSVEKVNNFGLVSGFKALIKNTNYETRNTKEFKNGEQNNEIAGVLGIENSYPLIKETKKYISLFVPKLMLRAASKHMRNIKDEEVLLNYDNLFSLNKGSQQDIIENNTNITYGFDYKINEKIDSKRFEKFSFSVGQVYNFSRNPEMPISSSLDRKSSDMVGKLDYNFRGIGGLSYNFGLAQDLNTLTYNQITGNLLFDKLEFYFDYLEENSPVPGGESYLSNKLTYNVSRRNMFEFESRKNFNTDSTEFYNASYQYSNDCLSASLEFQRDFYSDRDVTSQDSLRFTLRVKPFTSLSAPAYKGF